MKKTANQLQGELDILERKLEPLQRKRWEIQEELKFVERKKGLIGENGLSKYKWSPGAYRDQIIDSIITLPLKKLSRNFRHRLSLPEMIEQGVMPGRIPCINPCPRENERGEDYYFTCDTCSSSLRNPMYRSFYKKKIISSHLRRAVLERDNHTCQKCGSLIRLTIDHVIAESKGGKTELDNLQTLCKSCNSRKRTSDN
jgi:HNH endonuclease